METLPLSKIYTNTYIGFLKTIACDDPSLEDIVSDLTLGTILTEYGGNGLTGPERVNSSTSLAKADSTRKISAFQENELLAFGTPSRYHLGSSTRQRILKEINAILKSIAEFFNADSLEEPSLSTLPEDIQAYKDQIHSIRREVNNVSSHLAELIVEIPKLRQDFDRELKRAICMTLPTYDATRSASIDLLAATIESSLIKLSLVRARSERAFYNHQSRKDPVESKTMAQAIDIAYSSLKKEEKEIRAESADLDHQLQEYETLLRLVDGVNGGYGQIIKDWTKVKQDTDECLKDLRRLGWTGD